jgi:hypothetical protein
MAPSAPIPHRILTTNMTSREEGKVAKGKWLEGKVEAKTQSKMQNFSNERERILAEFSYSLVSLLKWLP